MQMLTFAEYTEMGGTLTDENQFNTYDFEAESIIHWHTFDRLKKETSYSDEVKQCVFMIVNLIADKYATLNASSGDVQSSSFVGQIASQSNDGVETRYVSLSPYNLLTFCGKEIDDIINYCLRNAVNSLGRKLLYRGYYPGE